MVFLANIPQPTDKLKDSQPQLLGNNQQLDSSFGVDHYTFSSTGGQTGKHNQVTTPSFIDSPPSGLAPNTIANEPKFYGFQDADQIGVIQYSRGPLNAIPSPLTYLHSTSPQNVLPGAINSITLLDFALPTVIPIAMGMAFAFSTTSPSISKSCVFFWWNGTSLNVNTLSSGASNIVISASGTTLILTNNAVGAIDVYWTVDLKRLQ